MSTKSLLPRSLQNSTVLRKLTCNGVFLISGRWLVISKTRRFANAPFGNVLNRFAYQMKRAIHMYISRSFSYDMTTSNTHVYTTRSRERCQVTDLKKKKQQQHEILAKRKLANRPLIVRITAHYKILSDYKISFSTGSSMDDARITRITHGRAENC